MAKIWMVQENGEIVTAEAENGEILLDVARRAQVALDAPCGGSGTCGKCRVRLMEGRLDSHESHRISRQDWDQGWRLACGSRIDGNAKILIPAGVWGTAKKVRVEGISQLRLNTVLSSLAMDGLKRANPFRRIPVELVPPDGEDTMPDSERLGRALEGELEGVRIRIAPALMRKLARFLRQNQFRGTVLGKMENGEFLAMDLVEPEKAKAVGCAIDIGTTTVAAVLLDLDTGEILAQAARGNGQLHYGADVISRIVWQAKANGRKLLQEAIVEDTLVPLLEQLCAQAKIWPEEVLLISVAANTTMNHLLVGCDAQSIRMEPYVPSFFSWKGLRAADLRIPANPDAQVLLSPNVGSYVGGDITAGVLASGIWNQEPLSLLVDLGTNGEIVLGNREFLLCCACSAGPAFEGGEISCGMRAAAGAIEAVKLDAQTLEPDLGIMGGGKAAGLCGSGLIDCVAGLFQTGAIDARGKFCRENARILRDENGMGRFLLVRSGESQSGREISLTEADIAGFIRAKAAVYSAIETMLDAVELPAQAIDRVLIAGGIGSGIRMDSALAVGMLPNLEQEKFRYIGNSALLGACAIVESPMAAEKCREIARGMTYLELSSCSGYMDRFVAASFLPHTDRKKFETVGK